MWNEILDLAIKNGLWAVLFLGLFIFVIRDSSLREKKYQQTIKDLTENLGIVKNIKEDVDEIKEYVYKNKRIKKQASVKKEENSNVQQKDGEFSSSQFQSGGEQK